MTDRLVLVTERLSQLRRFLRTASLTREWDAYAIPDTIAAIGGARPKTFGAFVREEQSAFVA